jgi:hypothetical protein
MKKPKTSVVSFTAYDTETEKLLLNVKRGLHSLRMMIKQCECKGRYYSRKFQILKAIFPRKCATVLQCYS